MDEPQKTLHELTALLARLPGVSVASRHCTPSHIDVTLRILAIESIGPVAYAAQGANIVLNIWSDAPGRPFSARADPALMCYSISAKNGVGETADALDRIQSFGVYIAWFLQGIGALGDIEANRVLALWNGLKPSGPT